jgi:uncharacterized protein
MKVSIATGLCALFFSVSPLNAQQTEEAVIAKTDTIIVTFPAATGNVNDFENLFNAKQIAELEKIISDFERETGNRIVVASIENITPYEKFDQYTLDLSNHWSAGTPEKDNGLTVMFSKSLRQIRISTGNGIENVISDEECKEVIDTAIIPEFKKGNFYDGVKLGVLKLIELWK